MTWDNFVAALNRKNAKNAERQQNQGYFSANSASSAVSFKVVSKQSALNWGCLNVERVHHEPAVIKRVSQKVIQRARHLGVQRQAILSHDAQPCVNLVSAIARLVIALA